MYRCKTTCHGVSDSKVCWCSYWCMCLISQRRLGITQQNRWCMKYLIHEMFSEDNNEQNYVHCDLLNCLVEYAFTETSFSHVWFH